MSCLGCALSKSKLGVASAERCNCGSLSSSDWLADVPMSASLHSEFVEVKFKKTRKAFFRNHKNLRLFSGDLVIVESKYGYDLGMVSLTGLLASNKKRKQEESKHLEVLRVLRKADQADIDLWQRAIKREREAAIYARRTAREMNLDMKVTDVEFQGDNTKAIFYYIAEGRVDFRNLIKAYASKFRIRIEMKQIGARQEAGRAGGLGTCGRELCCSTWLTDFRTVNTSAARYQQLSINPTKLTGQCGKLKCCLNFELDAYLDGLKEFPDEKLELRTQKGIARIQKMDIFRRLVWFTYEDEGLGLIPVPLERVKEIEQLNAKEEFPIDLLESTEGPQKGGRSVLRKGIEKNV